MSEGIFFLWKKKLIIVFFGGKFAGDYHNVAIIPTLFRDHRQKLQKPIFSLFSLLLTVITKQLCNYSNDMVIPGKFHPKKLYESVIFWEKKISIPERFLRFDLKIDKRPFCDVGRNFFFFLKKKVDYRVFRGEIYCRLPWCCNNFIIISGSQSKFEKSEFFNGFSTFDSHHDIIM